MSTFWLISLPKSLIRNGNDDLMLSQVRNVVNSADPQAALDLASLQLPELKVGTLDSLVVLADELTKLDVTHEAIISKLIDTVRNVPFGSKDQLNINGRSFDDYLRSFGWNRMKYRPDKSLRELIDTIHTEMTSLDSLLKTKSTQYTAIRNSLMGLQRKLVGNLSVKSLSSIVGPQHSVKGSEHLISVYVAVPKNSDNDWHLSYETLAPMVVPRSTQLVDQDSEFSLYSVVLFRKSLQHFQSACREKKFVVREFEFDESKQIEEKKELDRVEKSEKEVGKALVQWATASFGDAVQAWIHTKLVRLFTESVLRYGLPNDYFFAVIKPRQESKLSLAMQKHYGHLAGSRGKVGSESNDLDSELASAAANFIDDQNYCPYAQLSFQFGNPKE